VAYADLTEAQKQRQREACRRWRAAHPGKQYEACRRWDLANPDRKRALVRKHQEKNKVRYAALAREKRKQPDYLLPKYGITRFEYDTMRAQQAGACAICGKEGKLCIDHCHESKKVRGLLCRNCNSALGLLNEDFSTAIRAANYLLKGGLDVSRG